MYLMYILNNLCICIYILLFIYLFIYLLASYTNEWKCLSIISAEQKK